jgi:hypothetical protein
MAFLRARVLKGDVEDLKKLDTRDSIPAVNGFHQRMHWDLFGRTPK